MGIFEKFSNFKVNMEDQISADDKEKLEQIQKSYESTLSYYRKVFELYIEECKKHSKENKYDSFYPSSFDVSESVKKLQKSFSLKIYSYFSTKYGVDFEQGKFVKIYEDMRLRWLEETEINELLYKPQKYETVLEDVLGQLGGMSFNDVAAQQIKAKMKKICFAGNKWQIEVKNSTVKYSGWATNIEEWFGKYRIEKSEFVEILPQALGMFESNNEKMQEFDCFRSGYYKVELTEDQFKNGIVFPSYLKISSIKFFKNGRIDLKFSKSEYAREFAREWCGYTLV